MSTPTNLLRQSHISAIHLNLDQEPIPKWKWGAFLVWISALAGIALLTGLEADKVSDLAKNYTIFFIPIVSGIGLLMTLGLIKLFSKKSSLHNEVYLKRNLAQSCAVFLGATLIISIVALWALSPQFQKAIGGKSELLNPLLESHIALPIFFGTGALATGLLYYGLVYQHKKKSQVTEREFDWLNGNRGLEDEDEDEVDCNFSLKSQASPRFSPTSVQTPTLSETPISSEEEDDEEDEEVSVPTIRVFQHINLLPPT